MTPDVLPLPVEGLPWPSVEVTPSARTKPYGFCPRAQPRSDTLTGVQRRFGYHRQINTVTEMGWFSTGFLLSSTMLEIVRTPFYKLRVFNKTKTVVTVRVCFRLWLIPCGYRRFGETLFVSSLRNAGLWQGSRTRCVVRDLFERSAAPTYDQTDKSLGWTSVQSLYWDPSEALHSWEGNSRLNSGKAFAAARLRIFSLPVCRRTDVQMYRTIISSLFFSEPKTSHFMVTFQVLTTLLSSGLLRRVNW